MDGQFERLDQEACNILENVRDVSDFCEKWTQIRVLLTDENIKLDAANPETKVIFEWLVKMADRVCVLNPPN